MKTLIVLIPIGQGVIDGRRISEDMEDQTFDTVDEY